MSGVLEIGKGSVRESRVPRFQSLEEKAKWKMLLGFEVVSGLGRLVRVIGRQGEKCGRRIPQGTVKMTRSSGRHGIPSDIPNQ